MERNSFSDSKEEISEIMKICKENSLLSKFPLGSEGSNPIKKRKLSTERLNKASTDKTITKKNFLVSSNWENGKSEIKPKSPQKLKKFREKAKSSFKG